MEFTQILLWLVACALILVGMAGAVLPMLPGLPFVFGGLLLMAWLDHFERVGTFWLSVLGVLLVIGVALDFIASSFGAKKVGASKQAIAGATLGTVVGMFFGIPGLLIGPFVGAVIGELRAQRSLEQATAAGVGTWIGLLLGTIAKLVIAIVMVALFAFIWFV